MVSPLYKLHHDIVESKNPSARRDKGIADLLGRRAPRPSGSASLFQLLLLRASDKFQVPELPDDEHFS